MKNIYLIIKKNIKFNKNSGKLLTNNKNSDYIVVESNKTIEELNSIYFECEILLYNEYSLSFDDFYKKLLTNSLNRLREAKINLEYIHRNKLSGDLVDLNKDLLRVIKTQEEKDIKSLEKELRK